MSTIPATAQLLIPEAVLTPDGLVKGHAVLIEGADIAAIGPANILAARRPAATQVNLPDQVLMPGFVNAHQHGKTVSALQLGFADGMLESWLTSFKRRNSLDPYTTVLHAALDMAANGVTAAIHANTPYFTGDFPGEMRAVARAYADAGLRAMVGIGARDRAEVVYPDAEQSAFLAALPADLRAFIGDVKAPMYGGDAAATIGVMDAMQREHDGHPLVTFAYAPAGPQWVSDAMLAALAEDAAKRKVGIHMHGLESYAQAAVAVELYPEGFLKRMQSLGMLSPRLSLAHAVWLSAEDAQLAAATGITLVRNAGSNLKLRAGYAPLAHYLASGVNVALGSDSMALHEDEDLFKELRLAAGIARSPMWDAAAPAGPAAFLRMTTQAGAIAMQQAESIGKLVPGYRADLIAVSLKRVRGLYLDPGMDLATALYARAQGADVTMTMVNGRVIYKDGVFPHIDYAKAAANMAAQAEKAYVGDAKHRELADRLVEKVSAHYAARHARLTNASWTPLMEKAWP